MLKRVGKIAGYAAIWVIIIVMVVWANSLSNRHAAEQVVTETNISVEGGGRHPLVDEQAVRSWLKEQKIHPEGEIASNVDIAAIEQALAGHNAVAEANVYITRDGSVEIDIAQREPAARLRINGFDMYITEAGYLLPAKDVFAAYVPVITGDYKPLFGRKYMGYAKDVVSDSIAKLNERIAQLEEDKLPQLKALKDNNSQLREVKRSAPKKTFMVKKKDHEVLVEAYKERLSKAVAAHSVNKRRIMAEIAALEQEQERMRHKCEDIERQYDEFCALLDLLRVVRESKFWRAEVVQIVATGGGKEPLQLAIVPRSGRFTVDLGTTENLSDKLATLQRFYKNGLNNIGWDKYRHISLRYKGQVVCR